MGHGKKLLTWVGLSNFIAAWVGSGQPSPGLENFPQNPKFFNFYLRVKKISFGWVKKYLCQSGFGPLFTAGQMHSRVGSGHMVNN